MTKQQVLEEIKRTAALNGGDPLGRERFEKETGIKVYDWQGRYWARWGEALLEAGFSPNQLQGAYKDDFVIGTLVALTRELGRFPVNTELRLKGYSDKLFPSHNVFAKRLGSKGERLLKVIAWCKEHPGNEDVLQICSATILPSPPAEAEDDFAEAEEFGFVYLIKSCRFYKIGKTNAIGRRERELSIQLPERAITVHSIRTDDPIGIEAYWHKRFEVRRRNGEWFELGTADVKAFKRRKFM